MTKEKIQQLKNENVALNHLNDSLKDSYENEKKLTTAAKSEAYIYYLYLTQMIDIHGTLEIDRHKTDAYKGNELKVDVTEDTIKISFKE